MVGSASRTHVFGPLLSIRGTAGADPMTVVAARRANAPVESRSGSLSGHLHSEDDTKESGLERFGRGEESDTATLRVRGCDSDRFLERVVAVLTDHHKRLVLGEFGSITNRIRLRMLTFWALSLSDSVLSVPCHTC